jgi:hypothetical protein
MPIKKAILTILILLLFFSGMVNGAIPAGERAALIALYNATKGNFWTNNSKWLGPPGTEGTWFGITVTSEHVTRIMLPSNNLNGTLPSELGDLTSLTHLYLNNNQLTGAIPAQLGNLSSLQYLYLHYNQLNGSIPGENNNLSNLRSLKLNNNQFTGSIPPGLGDINQLRTLNLNNNYLYGPIPTSLTNLTNLTSLDIGYNCLCASDADLITWLDTRDPDWETNQSRCTTANIIVTSPNGGENLKVNSQHKITWTAPGNICNVKIEYSTNNGNTVWKEILTSPTSNDGSHFWTVPNEPSTTCKVRIKDAADGSPSDESNGVFSIVPTKPTVTTKDVSAITSTSAVSGGTVTSDGGAPVTARGVCWSISPNPTVSNSKTTDGIGTGDFTSNITGLKPNTTYYLRAYGTNSGGTLYGGEKIFTTHSQSITYTLTVNSSPGQGVHITVSPTDNNGKGDGDTRFFRTYHDGTSVTLTAPPTHNGKIFVKWFVDGEENTNRTINIPMNSNHTAQAVYKSPTYTLSVQSSPNPGVYITLAPEDNNGKKDGTTKFERIYDSGITVTLTAPSSFEGDDFARWTVSGKVYNDRTIQVTMDGDRTADVYFETPKPPQIGVSRIKLNLGYIIRSDVQPVETLTIFNSGGGTLDWTVSTDFKGFTFNPSSGTNCGEVEILVDADGFPPGKKRAVFYVSAPLADNSPLEVEVYLWVKSANQSSLPFGDFSTPIDGIPVSGSISLTGWALGDIGMDSVKIYREEVGNLVYIGDATFVEGARPDVEAAHPDYPMNYKAGWGYMMLTNFLPNGGNGAFKIHAIAKDREGREATLGTKTIIVDNANAVKPFGAIDTPTQGGKASESDFINRGWVLTPQPNKIPEDGSTINVYIDSVKQDQPAYYNKYRKDIAELFPGYENSNGAGGYFYLDTTILANGVHTIEWTAKDSAGNTDGIGSRHFTILNNCENAAEAKSISSATASSLSLALPEIPANCFEPIRVKKGWEKHTEAHEVYPDDYGAVTVEIKELERLVLILDESVVETEVDGGMERSTTSNRYTGYLVVDDELKRLPIGSTLDTVRGIFYWHPGPGFIGEYRLVFINRSNGVINKKDIILRIVPKFTKVGWHPRPQRVRGNCE